MKEDALYKRGLRLEYFTVAYNVAEAVASIIFGLTAGSVALVGFGLDSIMESLSGSVLIWRLSRHGKISREREEAVERKATKIVAVTFFILAAYVLYESVSTLVRADKPNASLAGVVIAALSVVVMPVLAKMKNDVGKELGSAALVADSKETLVCSFLSLSLLVGLGLNYLFGFWWADPVTGIVIVVFLCVEGYETLGEAGEEDEEP